MEKQIIAVIGAGQVGGALAASWARAGHTIRLGVRDLNRFKGQELIGQERISAHSMGEAVLTAGVVLVATPPENILSILDALGPLEGKVVIDATNAIRFRPEPYATAYHAFAERSDAEVVKCFNSTGFENMSNPDYGNQRLDMLMAGDSGRAKEMAASLARDAGFAECYDFGGTDKVILLEQFAMAWINLAIFQGMGRNIGFKLLRRQG